MQSKWFELISADCWVHPLVLNVPHSGTMIPDELLLLSRLSKHALRQSEDSFVDDLFLPCLELGMPMLRALVSRTYIDLNREPFELDARMFTDQLPTYAKSTSPRVMSGLGTIPRIVSEGEEIYRNKLPVFEAFKRIDEVHKPYHQLLEKILHKTIEQFNCAVLLDCHSMPNSAVQNLAIRGKSVDIVLGDRFGRSADAIITDSLEHYFGEEGFRVTRNRPYAGGFITETNGSPASGIHAVQIEINRSLYMNEHTYEKNIEFSAVQAAIKRCVTALVINIREQLVTSPRDIAAE